MTKTLQNVLADSGCMSENELVTLVREYPLLPVGIKFGASFRVCVQSQYAQAEIEKRIAANPENEYVRETFIPCNVYDLLRANPDAANQFAPVASPISPNWENSVESFLCRD